jgi:heme-degrading monooxygenase HmoA
MAHLLVKHTVKSYDDWKQLFEKHGSTRKVNGSQGGYVFRNADAPNEILVLLGWDGADRARQFAASDDLRAVMQRAGVQGQPEVFFLDEAEHPAA